MLRSPCSALLDRVTDLCSARGMNVVGAVTAAEYDAAQPSGRRVRELMPECGTILLLASGGRTAWQAVSQDLGAPPGPARPGYHPIDQWSRDVAREALAELERAGHHGRLHPADARPPLNFRQIAEMAGLGVISPVIGHLLHPVYGPWVSLRIAILLEGTPFGESPGEPLNDFEPCCTCHRPCVTACPPRTYAGDGRIDLMRCADWRLGGGCEPGCRTLRACPVGQEHRYGDEEEAFRHAYSLFSVRKWTGAGWWRLVPRFLRQRV